MDPASTLVADMASLAVTRTAFDLATKAYSVSQGNNRVEAQRLVDLRTQIEWLEERINAANGTTSSGGVAYASFGFEY